MSKLDDNEFAKDFDKRIAERKEKEAQAEREKAEELSQDYLRRTGRTRMEP